MSTWIEIHIPTYKSDNPNNEYPWIFTRALSKEVNSFKWCLNESDGYMVKLPKIIGKICILEFKTEMFIYYEKNNPPTISELSNQFKMCNLVDGNWITMVHPKLNRMASVIRNLKLDQIDSIL